MSQDLRLMHLLYSFQTATQQLNVIALSSSLGIMSKEKSAVGLFF